MVNINQSQLICVRDMIDVSSFLAVYLPCTSLIKGLTLSPIDLIAVTSNIGKTLSSKNMYYEV